MQLKMQNLKCLIPLVTTSVMLVGCSSSTDDTAQADKGKVPDTTTVVDKPIPMVVPAPAAPAASTLTLAFAPTKTFHFSWVAVTGATSYKLEEAATNGSGYSLVKETTATSFDHIVPLYARLNSKYILQSCNAGGCTASAEVFTSAIVADMAISIDYLKASNTGREDHFGFSVSLSADGNTLVVGADGEASSSKIINTGQGNGSTSNAGAVYVFTRNNTSAAWLQQAYLKADNAGQGDRFGFSVNLSTDGNTLAVGAIAETNDGSGPDNGSARYAGAAYVFARTGVKWSQQGYLKASNIDIGDVFGSKVSLSGDGNTLAVSATGEDSSETGAGGNGDNDSAENAGAVYVFTRSGALWSDQPTYLKASNTGAGDNFGTSLSLSADGTTLAVGANTEDGNETGASGNGNNNAATSSGAVYVFTHSSAGWSPQAYLKASNTGEGDSFGSSVSLSADGNTLAVGASGEKSNAKEINGDKKNNGAANAGAAYVFTRDTSATTAVWSEQAYLKASNTDVDDNFGTIVSLSADGDTLAVSAINEDGNEAGISINGNEGNGSSDSGAVYTFTRSGITWSLQAYLKASKPDANDQFGYSMALSANGGTLAVGAWGEDSNAIDINGDKDNGGATNAGAVYVY